MSSLSEDPIKDRWKEAQNSTFCDIHNLPRLDCGDETTYCLHCASMYISIFGKQVMDRFREKVEESSLRVEILSTLHNAVLMSEAMQENPDVTIARMIFARAQRFGQMADEVIDDICRLGINETEAHPSKRK